MKSSEPPKKKVYFPNLNGLRFLAALLVIIHHVEQLKLKFQLPNRFYEPFFNHAGRLGVILFFVLSGFLITYLLLLEKRETGRIAIRAFYIRRALRIWPLYYLIVFLGLFVLPQIPLLHMPVFTDQVADNFWLKLGLFVFMLPNLALVLVPIVPYINQSWTIGVEEQFYLFWPHLMKRTQHVLAALVGVILVYWSIRIGLLGLQKLQWGNPALFTHFYNFFAFFNIDCMAIGGIAAYIYFEKKESWLRLLYRPGVQLFIGATTLTLILLGAKVFYPFYALLFAIIILNGATNQDNIFRLEHPWLNYLGKISYGLYMYHSMVIGLLIVLMPKLDFFNDIVLYSASILLTIGISAFSYHLFEHKFIQMKDRFSKVLSGELARD